MDFIKKHYEKVILSLVLLGLVGALVFLPVLISNDHQRQEDMQTGLIGGRPTPLPPLDMSQRDEVLNRLNSPADYDFSTTNKLFNPMEWKKTPDGKWIKIKSGNEIGAQAVTIVKISPLYFVLTLDSVITNELGGAPRYVIGVERQAAANPALRRHTQRYISTDDPKKEFFTLLKVEGPAENPDQLILKLADTGESISLSKDKPYQHPDAYSADLKYDPEAKKWQGQRVGEVLKFNGDDYNIIAISQNELVLLQESNQKKWTLRYAP
jgi:hypothetical protein